MQQIDKDSQGMGIVNTNFLSNSWRLIFLELPAMRRIDKKFLGKGIDNTKN